MSMSISAHLYSQHHYTVSMHAFSWRSLEGYLNIVPTPTARPAPTPRPSSRSDNIHPLADMRRDVVLFCGLANDCVDFAIYSEECSEALCHTQTMSNGAVNIRNNNSNTASSNNSQDSTASLQHRGRVASMRRAQTDSSNRLGSVSDRFAR